MKVYDLTHTIKNDMPVYPGTEQPQLTTACTIEEAGYRETLLHMFSHTGTHMDAPAHMLLDGAPLDSYDADKFTGTAVVVDCRGEADISLPLLKRYDLDGVDFVLFCTGWDKKWGTPDYYEGFPCLTPDAAAYLATLSLKGVGEDSISLDPCGSVDFPNHITLLRADFVNTENLTGLDALIGRRFTFVTLPLKFENSDGCSCRAIAMEE
jgi:arylformamidase